MGYFIENSNYFPQNHTSCYERSLISTSWFPQWCLRGPRLHVIFKMSDTKSEGSRDPETDAPLFPCMTKDFMSVG